MRTAAATGLLLLGACGGPIDAGNSGTTVDSSSSTTGTGTPASYTSCDDLQEDWLEDWAGWKDDHDDCTVDADCASFWGPCYSGLDDCVVALSADVTQAEVDAWNDDYDAAQDAAGCNLGAVCDCYFDYEVACQADQCVRGDVISSSTR